MWIQRKISKNHTKLKENEYLRAQLPLTPCGFMSINKSERFICNAAEAQTKWFFYHGAVNVKRRSMGLAHRCLLNGFGLIQYH